MLASFRSAFVEPLWGVVNQINWEEYDHTPNEAREKGT
jgi:hypothetical protein